MKERNLSAPIPVVDSKELSLLDNLTERYKKITSPGKMAKLSQKAIELIPVKIKSKATGIGTSISEKELYKQAMKLIASGFKVIEEQAAKTTISEKVILKKINNAISDNEIIGLNEICFARSYDVSKIVNSEKLTNISIALVEGGATGFFGFPGLPFNIVLSTFIYFRAVQSIAMFYGYDVKNDSGELVIASEVFTSALNPKHNDLNNKLTSTIAKIMLMSKAAVIQQTAKKTWSDMIAKGGVPLLIAQMRALANKAAQKALEKAGKKGLENSVFREIFEQIGRKFTLKATGKAIPFLSAGISALIDTAQMNTVLNHADIFYHKRFILEKESRINEITNSFTIFIDAEIIDPDAGTDENGV